MMKKNRFKKIAVIVPVLTLSITTVASAQAETSKYRFSDQYQARVQANLQTDRVVSVVSDKVGLNKKNRNGKSKYRFSDKQKNQFSGYSSSKLVSKITFSKFKGRNGKTSKYRLSEDS